MSTVIHPPTRSHVSANGSPVDLSFLIREPAEVYHAQATECLSSHQLARFRSCPKLYRSEQLGLVPQKNSSAFVVGRAAHVLILEGRESYLRSFAIGGPTNLRTGNAYGARTKVFQEWAERQSKPVLTDSQAATIEQMAMSAHLHERAYELLEEGVAEGVIRCDYRGTRCQARLDWLHPVKGLVDLKTCEDLDSFEEDVRTFGYLHQMAFYRALLTLKIGKLFAVHLIAVEKRSPYRCGVWRIDPKILAIAERDNELAVERWMQCRQDDYWPTNYEKVRVLDHL